jgi:hypothetical protein
MMKTSLPTWPLTTPKAVLGTALMTIGRAFEWLAFEDDDDKRNALGYLLCALMLATGDIDRKEVPSFVFESELRLGEAEDVYHFLLGIIGPQPRPCLACQIPSRCQARRLRSRGMSVVVRVRDRPRLPQSTHKDAIEAPDERFAGWAEDKRADVQRAVLALIVYGHWALEHLGPVLTIERRGWPAKVVNVLDQLWAAYRNEDKSWVCQAGPAFHFPRKQRASKSPARVDWETIQSMLPSPAPVSPT